MNEREYPMIKLFDTPALVDALKNARRILLCTHINPDGDAIGSTLAVYHVLKKMGKDVTCACADPVPGKLMMLPGAEVFVQPDALEGQEFDLAFALDAADANTLRIRALVCCQNPTLNPMQLSAAVEKYLPHLAPDFTVYDASIRHAFQVGIQNNLVSARAMQDLYVLDAVMANINTDGLAHATDFRNQS